MLNRMQSSILCKVSKKDRGWESMKGGQNSLTCKATRSASNADCIGAVQVLKLPLEKRGCGLIYLIDNAAILNRVGAI